MATIPTLMPTTPDVIPGRAFVQHPPRETRRHRRGRHLAHAALLAVLSLIVGGGVATGAGLVLVAVPIVVACILIGLRDWRLSIYGLLIFLPYSGLIIIAAYPATGAPALVKDVLFVLPAYIGFSGALILAGQKVRVPGFPLGLVLLFALVVCLQLFNPGVPLFIVGLIGVKVWLLYIPMAYLGYHLIRTKSDLRRVLAIMCSAAVIPAVVGIIEGVIVGAGGGDIVYAWYGDAARAVTQQFAEVQAGDATINRIPSTFSFATQAYLFFISMLGVTYGYWRGFLGRSRRTAGIGAVLFILIACAALLTGTLGAILAVPVAVLFMLALDGVNVRLMIWLPLLVLGTLTGVASVFDTSASGLVVSAFGHGIDQFGLNSVDGFRDAFSRTIVGMGSGIDTVAARHSLPTLYDSIGGRPAESWWVKSVLELGVAGLVLAVAMLTAVLVHSWRAHRGLVDPQLRSVSSGLLMIVTFVVFYNFKGSYLDFDPTNVLFWLFVGILLKLPHLDERHIATTTRGSLRGAVPGCQSHNPPSQSHHALARPYV